ncbi:HEPN domain-containing protein [Fervidibacter sp.]
MGQGTGDKGQGKADLLERAKEFLRVAEMALDSDCYHAADLCAYAAMFWAAIVALERFGIRQERWSHGGLWSAFRDELVRKRHIYPDRFVDWLSDAYDLRNDAYYQRIEISVKKARRAVGHAREFVNAITEAIHK